MAVGVVISFGGAKSRAFRDDRPRPRSEDRPGHPRRRKPGHAGLADAPPASLPTAQRKSRGGENFPLRKALKTHETGKSTGSDRQRGRAHGRASHGRRRPRTSGLHRSAPCTGNRGGGENLRLHKALKTHETGKSTGSDRQLGASPWESLRWLQASAKVRPASRRALQRNSRGDENFPPCKALKTHETGKPTGADRQRGAM
jgi:hypothetical protein